MDSAIQASSSPASSSAFRSPCLTSASQNCKFPLPTSRVVGSKRHRAFRLHMDACPTKCHVVSRYSFELPDSQSIFSKKSINKFFPPPRALVASNTQNTSAAPLIGEDKVGVLLLNLGGPETLDDVQPFLFNLFADPDIIRLPRLFRFLQRPLARFISVLRSPKSREGYASIGGGSPLRKITDAQAEELKKALWQKDVPAEVYVGMRYWHPFTEEAIEQVDTYFDMYEIGCCFSNAFLSSQFHLQQNMLLHVAWEIVKIAGSLLLCSQAYEVRMSDSTRYFGQVNSDSIPSREIGLLPSHPSISLTDTLEAKSLASLPYQFFRRVAAGLPQKALLMLPVPVF